MLSFSGITITGASHRSGNKTYVFGRCDACGGSQVYRKDKLVKRKVQYCATCAGIRLSADYQKDLAGRTSSQIIPDNKVRHVWAARYRGICSRCNPNNRHAKRYGARGISNKFESLVSFLGWVVSQGADIKCDVHRVDPKSDYCPENCKLVPHVAHITHHKNVQKEATCIKRDALKKAANAKREARREAARAKIKSLQDAARIKKDARKSARRDRARITRETRIRNHLSKFLLRSKITVEELLTALGAQLEIRDTQIESGSSQLLNGSRVPAADYSI